MADRNEMKAARATDGGVITRCRLKSPIRAILVKPDGKLVSVDIPAGAVVTRGLQPPEKPRTLLGFVSAEWEGRHYSVSLNDLLQKAERVQSA